ncbi:hypothetical protein [Devosia sp. SL43]|uniref:hypothetical protein n=1 Tax=Devosia sp. SL43 TaxID=2806348 RepID=UPI001F17FA74|nr:hypothetical protein [Devosia sp. SL43]UJW87451.1 hypothetical protein IM737_09565 [Devosia sp. SL43]
MLLTTTTLYALPLIVIWLFLWMRVTSIRSAIGCSIGATACGPYRHCDWNESQLACGGLAMPDDSVAVCPLAVGTA